MTQLFRVIAVVVSRIEVSFMATCEDLVNAVLLLTSVIADVRDNYLKVHDSVTDTDVSIAGLLLRIERDLRIEIPATETDPQRIFTVVRSVANIATILDSKFTAREYTREADLKLIEVLQYAADSVTERIAQDTQIKTGATTLADTGVTDTTLLDVSTDTATQGLV